MPLFPFFPEDNILENTPNEVCPTCKGTGLVKNFFTGSDVTCETCGGFGTLDSFTKKPFEKGDPSEGDPENPQIGNINQLW